MIGSIASRPTSDPATATPSSHPPTSLAAALALLTIGICCLALLQLDMSLLRFLRSLDLSSVQRLGDWGEKVGNGVSLVAVSLILLGVGWLGKRPSFKQAGIESLLAHGCVALVVNGLKHIIGRPRPRMTHTGNWQWWPSWETGLDSFPSGHASAMFAVVTVLAKRWPQARWPGYGLAAWVAMSRVWRGSHFLADVMTGMVMGVVVGTIFAGPLREWRALLVRALVKVTPVVAAMTSLLWLMFHRIESVAIDSMLSMTGLGLIAAGLMLQSWLHHKCRPWRAATTVRLSIALVGVGLACTAGSFVPVLVSMLAAGTWWIYGEPSDRHPACEGGEHSMIVQPRLRLIHVVGVVGAALIIRQLQGVIPIH